MSAFHDVSLPMAFALGAAGGPEWKTQVTQLASGREFRNGSWSGSRRRWDVGGAVQSHKDLEVLTAFFEARRGKLYSFRFRDVTDWKSCPLNQEISAQDQILGVGNGEKTEFSLIKHYSNGGHTVERRITKPISNSIQIAISGQDIENAWHYDSVRNMIIFTTPPELDAIVSAGYAFDLHARFDTDILAVSLDHLNAGRVVSAPIIELTD